jgi:hypothetical protein
MGVELAEAMISLFTNGADWRFVRVVARERVHAPAIGEKQHAVLAVEGLIRCDRLALSRVRRSDLRCPGARADGLGGFGGFCGRLD